MNKIANIRDKKLKITASELKELITTELFNQHSEKELKNTEQQYNETMNKIEKLSIEIASMKEKLKSELLILEEKVNELPKHNDAIKQLETEKSKILLEHNRLETEKQRLKKMKLSANDQKLLDGGKKKLTLYKGFTRIRWDYSALPESLVGYVTNRKDYIHHFSHKKQGDSKAVSNLLWQEIFLSIGSNKEIGHCKENILINK